MMTFCPFLNGHFPSFYTIHGIFALENENYFNIHLTNYYKSMNRVLLFAVSLLLSMTAFAQTPEPTVIDDLSTYTGSDPYVLNKADGKVYVLNNLKEYERYGVYENVADLKIATPVVQKDIEYIETRLNTSTGFINTGYIHKSTTRVVADVEITQNTAQGWEAIFGARNGNWERNAFVVFYRSDKDGAGDKGCYSRTFEGDQRYEQPGTDEIPMNQRITVVAEGRSVSFTRQGESEPAAVITAGEEGAVANDGVNEMYIFDLNTDGPDGHRRDNSRGYMKVYSFKIYEDGNLVRDFVPVVTEKGEAALRDKLSGEVRVAEDGKVFLSPDGDEIANSGKGITVYEGKLVFNTTDQNLYKYTNGAFVKIGPRTFQPTELVEGFADYRNMNNWTTTDDHRGVFENRFEYDEAAGTNHISNYEGTGGFEPLWVKIPTIEGETYNFSFTFGCSAWHSWQSETMRAIVLNNEHFNITNTGANLGGGDGVLNSYLLPTEATEGHPVSLDFTAEQDFEMLVMQFGYVDDGAQGFWFDFNNLKLQKLEYPESYPVINVYKPQLADLIAEVEKFEGTTTDVLMAQLQEALKAAREVVGGDDMAAQREALEALRNAYNNARSINGGSIDALKKTIDLASGEGIDTNEASDVLVNGTNQGDLDRALRHLRDARKNFHAERQANVFSGHSVEAGEFYLYNVGQQRFLTGGSDWGAHAAMGMPGTLLKLENIDAPEEPAEGDEEANRPNVATDFHINTGLRNGGPDDNPSQYLSYRGYMDSGKAGAWRFIDLGNGRYNIVQADYPDAFVKFNPECSVDGGNGDYTTVCTEQRGELLPDDLDAQWMLVTEADRDALVEKATADAPVDASYKIVNPGFNQRAEVEPAWQIFNGSVWGRGGNHPDFALESWDSNDCSFSTSVEGLKPGYYLLTVQGFYRDGDHREQARLITEDGAEPAQLAYVYNGMQDVLLPNITAEVNKAPGLGNMTSVGEYPDGIDQAVQFFQLGLYKVQLLVEVDASGVLDIGVAKDEKGHNGDWVVVDNFRLIYFGATEPTEEQIEHVTGIEPAIKTIDTPATNGRIYNLQGMEVKSVMKGHVYIKDGRKFIVK